jgi:hypothetical protein
MPYMLSVFSHAGGMPSGSALAPHWLRTGSAIGAGEPVSLLPEQLTTAARHPQVSPLEYPLQDPLRSSQGLAPQAPVAS